MRLFWKILLGYFLAWSLLTLALFGAMALDQWTHFLPRSAISQNLPAKVGVQVVSTSLKLGGTPVVEQLSKTRKRGEPPFVINEEGRELLGREVDAATVWLARSMAVETAEPAPVKRVSGPEGEVFWVFYPDGKGPEDGTLLHWFFQYPWLIGALFAVAGLLLAGGLTAAWTRPIAALKEAFDRFSDGDLKLELGPQVKHRRDEIGDLGRHFEAMADKLVKSVDGRRRLLHDVSHELRSPLARLGVAVELARRRPEHMELALERIERECGRLDRLIGEVLTLARLEDGAVEEPDDYFDLLEMLRVIHDDVKFEADAVGIEVELHIPDREELIMRGSAELLHRAVENVVRNALKHATGSGRIELKLDEPGEEDRIRLRVCDDGDTLPPADLESIFEPFIHGKASSGFGLGLAIAKRAVEIHRGTIRAVRRSGSGLEMLIDLPHQL